MLCNDCMINESEAQLPSGPESELMDSLPEVGPDSDR